MVIWEGAWRVNVRLRVRGSAEERLRVLWGGEAWTEMNQEG